jgi:hypothetical protein
VEMFSRVFKYSEQVTEDADAVLTPTPTSQHRTSPSLQTSTLRWKASAKDNAVIHLKAK